MASIQTSVHKKHYDANYIFISSPKWWWVETKFLIQNANLEGQCQLWLLLFCNKKKGIESVKKKQQPFQNCTTLLNAISCSRCNKVLQETRSSRGKKWTLQKSPFKATFLPLKALGNKSVISFLKERSKMCQMET